MAENGGLKSSDIHKVLNLLSPKRYINFQKYSSVKRNNYDKLITQLSLIIFKKVSKKYNFLELEKRDYLLFPVLSNICGLWATYIANIYFRTKEISLKDLNYLKNSKEIEKYFDNFYRRDISLSNFNDLTALLFKDDDFIPIIFCLLYKSGYAFELNKKYSSKKIEKSNINNISREYFLLDNRLKDFFINIRNIVFSDRIYGLNFIQIFLVKIFVNSKKINLNYIIEDSIKNLNRFIEKNITLEKEFEDFFDNQKLDLLSDMSYSLLPSFLKVNRLKKVSILNPKYKKINFFDAYQFDPFQLIKIFQIRLSGGISIGSQHGASYGFEKNHIRSCLSEYFLESFISSGFTSKHYKKIIPTLDFLPAGFVYRNKKINPIIMNFLKKIGSANSIMYIESLCEPNLFLSIDSYNQDIALSKYRTFILMKELFMYKKLLSNNKIDNIFIKSWVWKQKYSVSKELFKNSKKAFQKIEGRAFKNISLFNGLIILDDISTAFCECIFLEKPFLVLMNTHYEYTPFARELFWEMENFGYITFTKKDAYKTIKNYLSNPIQYFCEGEYFSLSEFSEFLINKIYYFNLNKEKSFYK